MKLKIGKAPNGAIALQSDRGQVCEMLAGYDQTRMQDAQTIAHRVNVHDELVAALEFTQKKLFNMTTEEFRNGGDTTIRATIAIALERANP